jgi:hypothetical protein
VVSIRKVSSGAHRVTLALPGFAKSKPQHCPGSWRTRDFASATTGGGIWIMAED